MNPEEIHMIVAQTSCGLCGEAQYIEHKERFGSSWIAITHCLNGHRAVKPIGHRREEMDGVLKRCMDMGVEKEVFL